MMIKKSIKSWIIITGLFLIGVSLQGQEQSGTIAVWLFEEPQGLYPSSVIHDVGPNDYLMALGRGGKIVEGKFGNALEIIDPEPLELPQGDFSTRFGLKHMPTAEGRTVPPMTWENADFSVLMTSGDNHLRKELNFTQPTLTRLNLGDFDWTVEFWFKPTRQNGDEGGVIFEIGQGPRGENKRVTRLLLNTDHQGFTLWNYPGNTELKIPSDVDALDHAFEEWHHYAFVYSTDEQQLRHFVNGALQTLPEQSSLQSLQEGEEDYFTVGRDAMWERPLPGIIDELRFSSGRVYDVAFEAPGSLADHYLGELSDRQLKKGKPLLFPEGHQHDSVVEIGNRKHLFIDDAIVETKENITFNVNPPKIDQLAMRIEGTNEGTIGEHQSFRKHITLLEDEDGLIRLYNALDDDYLGVWVSKDGVNFEAPDTGIEHKGNNNIVIPDNVGTGTVIIDPNAPEERRWKYISDVSRRGVYVYTSPDGWSFKRHKQAVSPFRSGSQMDLYYDDQRQIYTGFHRSDFFRTPLSGRTLRTFVMTEKTNLMKPWPYEPATPADYQRAGEDEDLILHDLRPWYLDNGPLTPGGWGVEYPVVFKPDYDIDPANTAGIYNPKAMKYPWAPDTYVAFPIYYLYYYDGVPGSQVLSVRHGGGPTETQFAASRDGVNWKRYPRPTYVGMGRHDDIYMAQTFIAQGMVKRGDEIWQYVFFDGDYHTHGGEGLRQRRLYRLIQRFDGFVSADSPYEKFGEIVTRPLAFDGDRLVLNIDTDAHGYAMVGLLDEDYNPIPGYSLDDAVFINGDHIEIDAEWLDKGTDVSSLKDQTVRVVIKMRGAKLYSMQFQN